MLELRPCLLDTDAVGDAGGRSPNSLDWYEKTMLRVVSGVGGGGGVGGGVLVHDKSRRLID
jgi:hypothetical protein